MREVIIKNAFQCQIEGFCRLVVKKFVVNASLLGCPETILTWLLMHKAQRICTTLVSHFYMTSLR